jgi:hypothetical protein
MLIQIFATVYDYIFCIIASKENPFSIFCYKIIYYSFNIYQTFWDSWVFGFLCFILCSVLHTLIKLNITYITQLYPIIYLL